VTFTHSADCGNPVCPEPHLTAQELLREALNREQRFREWIESHHGGLHRGCAADHKCYVERLVDRFDVSRRHDPSPEFVSVLRSTQLSWAAPSASTGKRSSTRTP
jgi:hypothetical protein